MEIPADVQGYFCTLGMVGSLILILNLVWKLFTGFKVFIQPYFERTKVNLVTEYGSWAIVTGATDGIGLAYSKELAQRGVNIVLISRTLEKLKRVASEIENEFGVKTKVILADFSRPESLYEHIERELEGIPVGILVNNVGVYLCPYPMYFNEMSEKLLWDTLNVNCSVTLMMTKMILPQMLKRRKGAIVNLSSIAELQPAPLISVYAASKVFTMNFTEALRFESRNKGITIQMLSPFVICTNLVEFRKPSQKPGLFTPDATEYARHAIKTLGVSGHTTGYWPHSLIGNIKTFPLSWSNINMHGWGWDLEIYGIHARGFFREHIITTQKHLQRKDETITTYVGGELIPVWLRMLICYARFYMFRKDYLANKKKRED